MAFLSNASSPGRRLAIVHVTTFYPPFNFGGDGVHVQRLARAQVRRGHRVTVVHAPAAHGLLRARHGAAVGDGAQEDGVRLEALHGWRGRLEAVLIQQTGQPVLSRRRLRRLLDGDGGNKPDVVHFHNVSLVGGVGILGMGAGSVRLFTAHEYWAMCPTHVLFRYNREPCTRRTCVRCTLRAGRPPQWWRAFTPPTRRLSEVDHILYPSELVQSLYLQNGVNAPGTVLRNFVADDVLTLAASSGRRRADVDPYFLYVGRLEAIKGVEPMLQAFLAGAPPAPLWIAGQGPLDSALRARYGGHPAVRFLGQQEQAALSRLYRDAVAVVLPSVGHDIFATVSVEAYAHGTPVLASSHGGARELVRDSGGGHVFASGSEMVAAMAGLVADLAARDRMGDAGLRYVTRELGESAYLDRYEALVQEVAK